MARHTGTVSKRVSEQFRRLDRRLHIERSGRSEWIWAIPIVGFAVWVATLVFTGVMTGVWAAEFIPTALVEGLVIAGLFVICLAPETAPPENGPGDRVRRTEPPSTPTPSDPTVWLAMLAELDGGAVNADRDSREESLREHVGAPR
jgi:hypothetical protein